MLMHHCLALDCCTHRPALQVTPLSDMETRGLLAKVASEELSLMVVVNERSHCNLAHFQDGTAWQGAEVKRARVEESCRRELVSKLGQARAESVPVVTVRAVGFVRLMAAINQGQLMEPEHSAAAVEKLLQRTGQEKLFQALITMRQ